jgi:hypothetical protein
VLFCSVCHSWLLLYYQIPLVVVWTVCYRFHTFTTNPWFRNLDFIVKIYYDRSFLSSSVVPNRRYPKCKTPARPQWGIESRLSIDLVSIHDWGIEGHRLCFEPETAKVEERLFQRELADDQRLDDEPRSAVNRGWLCHLCLSIVVGGKGRRGVDRDMEFPKGRDECVGSALHSFLRYVGGCASRVVPSVLGLLTPSLLRLLLRWDGGDHK